LVDKTGANAYSLRLMLLSSWANHVPSNLEIHEQLKTLLTASGEPGDLKERKARANALFSMSYAEGNSGEDTLASARKAFDAFEAANDSSGMLESLSVIVKPCMLGPSSRHGIDPKCVADIGPRVTRLLLRASAQTDDKTQWGVLLSTHLRDALQSYVTTATPEQAHEALSTWAESLNKITETDPLCLIRVRQAQSLAMALLARADWRLDKLGLAEVEYRQSMKMSQELADDTARNLQDIQRRKEEARANAMKDLHVAGATPQKEDLEFLLMPFTPNLFAMDKAFAQFGLGSLLCVEQKFSLAEQEYRQARKLPVGMHTSQFCGLVSNIAEGYLSQHNIDKARECFGEIKKLYGSYWLLPFPERKYEDPVIGPISTGVECVNRCTKFMSAYPSADDAQVLARFAEFKKGVTEATLKKTQ
jgi:tetratricopeptide (TPR) repeat protein